jgi:prepilin-type processing-associated H-X9-DG protein/prepilin-type N-terminal cleavage/methylation domain-containing protein
VRGLKRSAFTIVELLIAVAIIAILISILFPVIGRARECARRISCANNQKQILLAMLMYSNENRGYLPLPVRSAGGLQLGGIQIWMPGQNSATVTEGYYDYQDGTIWPYLGLRDPAARQQLFTCPSDPEPRTTIDGQMRNFSYTFNWELYYSPLQIQVAYINRTPIPVGVRVQNIRGTEHKMIVIEPKWPSFESQSFLYVWQFLQGQRGYDKYPGELSDRHSGMANIGMADGHVELVDPNEIDTLAVVPTGIWRGYYLPAKYNYYLSLQN